MAYYNCDSTSIRLRFGLDSTTTKNEYVHVFADTRGYRSQSEGRAGQN